MMLCKVTRNGWDPPSSGPLGEQPPWLPYSVTGTAQQCCKAITCALHAQTWNPQATTPFCASALAAVTCSFLPSCSAFEQRYCGPHQATAIAKYVDISRTHIQFSLSGRTYTGCWSNDEQKSYSKRWWLSLLSVDWFPIWTFPVLKKNFFCSAIGLAHGLEPCPKSMLKI